MRRVKDYKFGTKPFAHQVEAFLLSRDKEGFALLMEQGTGKTKVALDVGCYRFGKGSIDAILVIAPNGVHRNWIENECPIHMPEYVTWHSMFWRTGRQGTKWHKKAAEEALKFEGLSILAINIEGIRTKDATNFLRCFMKQRKVLLVVDESTTIKTPGSKRTKRVLAMARYAVCRLILTGTPVTQGPLDLYSQFNFLNEGILGFGSFIAFKHNFAVWKRQQDRKTGHMYDFLVGYKNLKELRDLIKPHSYRVKKSECLDLPPKLYQRRYIQLTKQQQAMYDKMRKEMLVELWLKMEGEEYVSMVGRSMAAMAMVRMLRLQQITSGFLPLEMKLINTEGIDQELMEMYAEDGGTLDPSQMVDVTETMCQSNLIEIEGKNPRLEALIEIMEQAEGKVLIWARFRRDIDVILERFKKEKIDAVRYDGIVGDDDRADNIRRFQDKKDPSRAFVGNPHAGGRGLTLHAATTVVYYSNDFSLETRMQSEDRAHRIGQEHPVIYIDIIAEDTVDEKIVVSLREKRNVADAITGDNPEEWI